MKGLVLRGSPKWLATAGSPPNKTISLVQFIYYESGHDKEVIIEDEVHVLSKEL